MYEKGRMSVIISVALILALILPTSNLFANKTEQDPKPQLKQNDDKINTTPPGWSEDVRQSLVGNTGYPDIVTNGTQIHIVWRGGSGSNEGIYYRKSLDNGRTWYEEKVIGYDANEAFFIPAIAINNSVIHVVWEQTVPTGRVEIFYSKSADVGETWCPPIQLSEGNNSDSEHPDIACWGNNVYIVWQDDRNAGQYDLYLVNSSDVGENWSINKRITFTADPDWEELPQIGVNDTNLHIAYNMRTGVPFVFEIFYMNSTDEGVSWNNPIQLSTDNDMHSQRVNLAINESKIHTIWEESKMGSWDIFYRNSTNGGVSFNPEVRLTDNANWENTPTIFAENENLYVVWADNRDQPGTGSDLYFKNSTDGGISWTTDARLTFTAVDNYALSPKVTTENGMIHVLWEDKRDTASGEVYYKRYPDFPADTTPPTITHPPITESPINQPIDIIANITDDFEVSNVTLYYVNVGETTYTSIDMTLTSGNNQSGDWTAMIPAQTETGLVHYFIWANDTSGNNITSPIMGSYAIQITGPPNIEITNPLGGEDWTGGSNHQIEFTASDTEDAPAVLDVFLNYTSITAGNGFIAQIKGDESPYDWTLPFLNATDVKINATVIDSDGNKEYYDSLEFTIDSSPPEVVSTNPVNNTTGISIYQPIVIQFNEPMNISSVVVNQTNGTDPGGWSWFWNEDKNTVTGIHDSWLREETIEITIQAGYIDDSDPGNANTTSYVFSFTTETNPSPEILHTNISGPQELGDEIRINATITDDGTVMNSVLWWQGVDDVWHENYMDKNGNDWEYTILAQMTVGKVKYQINATDDFGQKNSTMIYEFNIRDSTPPVIIHTPVESAFIGEAINITCEITDLGGVNIVYMSSGVFFVYRYEGDTDFIFGVMNPGYWFELPAHSVPATIEYYIQASDIYGNDASTQTYNLEIIDPTVPDTTPPEVLLATPTGDNIPISTNISIVFNEAINQTSVENAISISPTISGVSYTWMNNQTLIIEIFGNLSYNTTYSVTIDTGAKDVAGNTLANDYSWQFTTVEEPEIVQPPASNDWGWIMIIIILSVIIALLLFYQFNKERKEKEEEE